MLDRLLSSMSYSTVGCEFKIWYTQTKEEENLLSVYEATLEYTKATYICSVG